MHKSNITCIFVSVLSLFLVSQVFMGVTQEMTECTSASVIDSTEFVNFSEIMEMHPLSQIQNRTYPLAILYRAVYTLINMAIDLIIEYEGLFIDAGTVLLGVWGGSYPPISALSSCS